MSKKIRIAGGLGAGLLLGSLGASLAAITLGIPELGIAAFVMFVSGSTSVFCSVFFFN